VTIFLCLNHEKIRESYSWKNIELLINTCIIRPTSPMDRKETMKTKLLILLLSLNLFSTVTLAETNLTQASISEMLVVMQVAAENHNAEGVVKNFSPDAEITFDMAKEYGGRIVSSVSEYKEMLIKGWAMPAEFTYEMKDELIVIAPDSKNAVVTDTVIETVTINGKKIMTSTAQEKVEIEFSEGKIIITSLYGKMDIEMHM
jgi:hypothetical protein